METVARLRIFLRQYKLARFFYSGIKGPLRKAYILWLRIYYGINRSASPPPAYYLNFLRTTLPIPRPEFGRPPGDKPGGMPVPLKVNSDGSRDFSDYVEAAYLEGGLRYETYDYFQGRVRKEDMGCAALYAFGIQSFEDAQKIFPETTFQDQVRAVLQSVGRQPKYIAEIGCGFGSLSALFLACGVKLDAIDPAPVAPKKVTETIPNFTGRSMESFQDQFCFLNMTLSDYMKSICDATAFPDTFVFVESIEHIPQEETMAALTVMRERGNCRLIVTNAVDYHPICPDGTGWDHITLIDDRYYDSISSQARKVILRAGSHLVLEF